MSDQSLLTTLKDGLEAAYKKRKEMLESFNPKQRVLYNNYEQKVAILTKSFDFNGIEKLKEDFTKKFNEAAND